MIKCGIPQSSCLEPLLFTFHVIWNFLNRISPNMYVNNTCVDIALESSMNFKQI